MLYFVMCADVLRNCIITFLNYIAQHNAHRYETQPNTVTENSKSSNNKTEFTMVFYYYVCRLRYSSKLHHYFYY